MSLLITSNTAQTSNYGALSGGINRPFSFQNHLSSTIKIPKNSEIAVQSVKINREGNISTNRLNNQFYIYFGQELTGELNIEDTTNHPALTWLRGDTQGNDVIGNYNTDEFAEAVQDSMRRALYYPQLQPSSVNTSSAQVSVQRNGSNLDFEGYNISLYSASSGDNACRLPATWISVNENDFVGSRFTKTESSGSVRITHNASDGVRSEAIGTNYPLSLLNGSCIFEVDFNSFGWEVGLVRSLRTTREDPTRLFADDNLAYPTYFFGGGAEPFFDWSAKAVFDASDSKIKLRLYHAVWNNSRQKLEKREFVYGTALDITAEKIDNVVFKPMGERMHISVVNQSGVSTTLATGSTGAKATDMKPVSLVTSCLFPKISQIEKNKFVKLINYQGVDITNWKYGSEDSTKTFEDPNRQTIQDFWATQVNLNKVYLCKNIESRYMFDYDDGQAYTQKGLAGSGNWVGATDGYLPVYIFTESQKYTPSRYAGISGLLGFKNNGVVTGETQFGSNRRRIVISPEIPKFLSTNSMFVRINDLAVKSFNLSKGSISKIVYHMPRFDNTGNEVGGLFFEPAERVYLDINNPDDLYINNMQVDIVNSDETLATNLTGKTIVIFHIRQKKD